MVPRPEQALQEDIEAFRDIFCEDHIFRGEGFPAAAEEAGQEHADIIDQFLRGIGSGIAAAARVAAAIPHEAEDGFRRAGGFGKAGAGLVQVYFLHGILLIFIQVGYPIILYIITGA